MESNEEKRLREAAKKLAAAEKKLHEAKSMRKQERLRERRQSEKDW